MGLRDLTFLGVISSGLVALAVVARSPDVRPTRPRAGGTPAEDLNVAGARIDTVFAQAWHDADVDPAAVANDLLVMRRLALALAGTIPSLEEIRRFEAGRPDQRIGDWIDVLLADRRTSDYLAERFARAFVGTEDGPFILFRRRRFTSWLSDTLLANRPYDEIVRALISDGGLWTDHPATNFVTVTFDQERGRPDPERLAARVSRCFLGTRIDCAQCHDHPFQAWKQSDFRGLAAFFGGVHSDLRGIREGTHDYAPMDPANHAPSAVDTRVPYQPEFLPAAGGARNRLASWVTHPKNTQLARATVNRVWAMLYGRPLHDPVDDLPPEHEQSEVLEQLAADFSAHGYDLHRLIRLIARSAPFRLDSVQQSADRASDSTEADWASFPMTRLRPEQVAGAVSQAASLSPIGPESFWLVRLSVLTARNEFVKRYGDAGEDEFEDRSGTLTQRLLLMNGDHVRDKTSDGLFSAVTRIAQQARSNEKAVEAAYLVVLTRRPTADELAHFAAKLEGTKGPERIERVSDLFWTLFNTTEFSWNH